MSIGQTLDSKGWRQGSLVRKAENYTILEQDCEKVRLIVISQSCDIIKVPNEAEPFVELIVARPVQKANGNYTHNKNPRVLHLPLQTAEGEQYLELIQNDKLQIPREILTPLEPDDEVFLGASEINLMARWLASRYQRPAFPNEFNKRIDAVKRNNRKLSDKERKAAKKLSPMISGIYLSIQPFSELTEGESYSVNLLALVPVGRADIDTQAPEIRKPVEAIVNVIKSAGMEIEYRIEREDKVPYSMFRDMFKPWSYDDLSLREEPPHTLPIQ